MADPQLLRTTLDALDDFVDRLRRRAPGGVDASTVGREPRLVIDEGRGAAEWTVDIDVADGVHEIGLLVVCDVEGNRLTDARLYVTPSSRWRHSR